MPSSRQCTAATWMLSSSRPWFEKIILGWLDSEIRRRKRACNDVTESQILVVFQCRDWLIVKIPSFCAGFDLNNLKSVVNKNRFQKTRKCAVCIIPARDEGICTNSQTQHWMTTNIWLVVTSSQASFLHRISKSSQPCIILYTHVTAIVKTLKKCYTF